MTNQSYYCAKGQHVRCFFSGCTCCCHEPRTVEDVCQDCGGYCQQIKEAIRESLREKVENHVQ